MVGLSLHRCSLMTFSQRLKILPREVGIFLSCWGSTVTGLAAVLQTWGVDPSTSSNSLQTKFSNFSGLPLFLRYLLKYHMIFCVKVAPTEFLLESGGTMLQGSAMSYLGCVKNVILGAWVTFKDLSSLEIQCHMHCTAKSFPVVRGLVHGKQSQP